MYSQNIDTLEQKAGIKNVLQCHGSFATATCTDPSCKYQVHGDVIRDDILARRIPECPKCSARREEREEIRRMKRRKTSDRWDADQESDEEPELAYGILKPDITFFGEKLPDDFDRCVFEDRDKVDLILVMGTSLKVAPVADLLSHLPSSVPVVLINRTPITHMAMDVMLLGNSDEVVQHLCRELDWPGASSDAAPPERVAGSHVYQYPGADGGWYVDQLLGVDRDSDEPEDDEASEPHKITSEQETSAHDLSMSIPAVESTTDV